MVELCAGSAILSAEAQKRGFQVFPMDHSKNRFRPAAAIFQVDLSSQHARELLPQMFHHIKPRWCHLGLPCGTASRARERPIGEAMRKAGAPQPRPLRDTKNLFGFSHLTTCEKARVDAANAVYQTGELSIFMCFRLGAIVSIENPERSWLWAILSTLVKSRGDDKYNKWYFDLEDVSFDGCMHGGDFPKTTRLKATAPVFSALSVRCDNSHSHAAWGVRKGADGWIFDTANGAAYPRLLAQRMVECVANHIPDDVLAVSYKHFRLDLLQQSAVQSKRHHALVPEFADVLFLPEVPHVPHKLLSQPWPEGGEHEGWGDSKRPRLEVKVGIYFTPFEHIERALSLKHPASLFAIVPDVLRLNLFELFVHGSWHMAKKRINALKDVLEKKKALMGEEEDLRKGLPEHVNEVTRGKSLRLFRVLLEETGFEDMTVCDMMEQGVSLTGVEPESPLYMKKYVPASLTVEQLNHQAAWRRKATMSKPLSGDEVSQLRDLEAETMEEVKAGFLQGPFDEQQVTEQLKSDDWSLTRRFVLYQGEEGKIRVIDNYRDSAVNSAFASSSYLALQDTDFIVGFLRFLMIVSSNPHEVVIPLRDGRVLRGKWHETLRERPQLLARCVDLSKAYKQVAIHSSSLIHGVLGYPTGEDRWKLFTTSSLPFGACASVFAFNKISRALWHLLTHKFGLLAAVFYDDYPCFEIQPLANLTTKTLDGFFSALGWRHAVVGKKATDFSSTFVALGVQYSLDKLWHGSLVLQNKPGRLERIISLIKSLAGGHVTNKTDIACLSGLLNFAGGFVMGHSFKPALHYLNKWASTSPSESQRAEVCNLVEVLVSGAKPREVQLTLDLDPLIVYTDGAFEKGVATWGALVFDPATGERLVFAGTVPSVLCDYWLGEVGQQIICEVETYAYICVRWHLRKRLYNRLGICFIDNEASRVALIKRSSQSHAMFLLVAFISLVDSRVPFGAWVERVPSAANPADLPSRGESRQLCEQLGALDCGDILLPAFVFSFLMSKPFSIELAEVVMFEAEVS